MRDVCSMIKHSIKMTFTYLFILLVVSGYYCNDENPVVTTPLGSVRGYIKTSFDGRKFAAFEGIPYAKPPIGERRFEEPEPIEPWIGTWNASFPTECAQTKIGQGNLTTGDENCLHINVYVPRENPNPEAKLDVIVHIHGGAYEYGSGHLYSKAEPIMDRDVIFVTFNYRVGILGFLSTEDDVVPGNNGLKDQSLALKWIQENIASFGGNPDSVTITGLSAGGGSVHFHYFSEWSRGLFHKGFSQSGVVLNPWCISEEPLSKAKFLGDSVGCPTDSTKSLVDCLKQRPARQLLEKLPLFFDYYFIPIAPFGPVIEKGGSKPFLSEHPYNLLVKGQVADVPWIASTTIHEGLFPVQMFSDLDYVEQNWEKLAPSLLDFNYTLAPTSWNSASRKIKEFYLGTEKISKPNMFKLVRVFTDRYFATDAKIAAKLQANVTKSPVYYYIFAYPGDNNELKGVSHGAEAKYEFTATWTSLTLTSDEIKMKDLLLNLMVSYAKDGKPSVSGVDWKPTSYDKLTYLNISGFEPTDIKLQTTEDISDVDFWSSLNLLENEHVASGQEN